MLNGQLRRNSGLTISSSSSSSPCEFRYLRRICWTTGVLQTSALYM